LNFYKRVPFILLSIYILLFALLAYQTGENRAYSHREQAQSIGIPALDIFDKDPVMKLLGKSFDEIEQAMGKPDEQGYSTWLGPHYYILFRQEKGVVRFASPEPENKIAVSIILGPGQEVLGTEVGMLFLEVKDILGVPGFGPELGVDNLFYMDYYFGEIKNQAPEVFISFSAYAVNGPTHVALIKWEGFEYD
jgi:hypothetical protein